MNARTLALTLSLLACQVAPGIAVEARAEIEEPRMKEVTLADQRLTESSGLERSLRHPGVFWTHNDSAGEPCLFAINAKGATVAKVRVPKAANFDWEDVTQGLDAEDRPCLYIGDIGDNLRVRLTIQIYKIPEPDLPEDPTKEVESAEPEIWHLNYPDGRHNAECLMMHPQTRRLYLLTKKENGLSALYQVPDSRVAGRAMKLEKITSLTFPAMPRLGKRPSDASATTGGAFSPDGRRLVISTYSYLHEWRLTPGRPLVEVLKKPPHLIMPPLARQMEAVCYDADNVSLWFTSEQLPAPLYHLLRD